MVSMDRHSKDDPTNQYSVNESEWEEPANWCGNLLYHSKRRPAFGPSTRITESAISS